MVRRVRLFASVWRLIGLAGLLGGIALLACSPNNGSNQPSPVSDASNPGSTASGLPLAVMGERERQYLWEIEHHGLVLSRNGFKKLGEALGRADSKALSAFLSPAFVGQKPQKPNEVRVANDFVKFVRSENAGNPPEILSAKQFCDCLLAYRRLFGQQPKLQFSLMALSPTVRGDLESPWQGSGQLRMWGKTASGGPGEVVLHLHYQVRRPTDDNLRKDGWLQSCSIMQSQVAESPRFLLREATLERGIDSRRFHDNWLQGMKGSTTGGVYLCDFNRDGILDMLVVDINSCALYKGLPGGKFVDVTLEVGLPWRLVDQSSSHLAAAFVDLDGNGWEDLILDQKIFRNEGGKQFRDVTHLSNLHLHGAISGYAVADYDRDGRLDVYVARPGPARASSWLDGKCGGQGGNLLFHNKGNWQFEEVAAASGASGGDRSCFSAVWLDANNDGWPDLYVINEFGNGVLLLNQGNGTFREQLLASGPGDFGSMGVTAGDIDNDGNIDLYVANMYSKAGNRVINNVDRATYSADLLATMRSFVAGSQLWRNQGIRSQGSEVRDQVSVRGPDFEPLGQKYQVAAVGWAYGPALVDLDNDGWLDLYTTAGFVSQNRTEPDG